MTVDVDLMKGVATMRMDEADPDAVEVAVELTEVVAELEAEVVAEEL